MENKMSCMRNVDPHNNAPPGNGTCGAGRGLTAQEGMAPQFRVQQPQQPQRPDLATENRLLFADLELAVRYIRHLGGTWPPPGHN